jgi:hypothetical protein
MPIAPASPSPYFLWVSVETQHPAFFQVVFESPAWAYRTAEIAPRNSAPASVRAEIRLVRMRRVDVRDLEQGTVWIERRPRFLTRKYEPGERVGKYSVAYLARLGHE